MQFKHPEILYGLLLLIIPIIVHLFQLQRFVKTPFTNVKFLQQIILQTRKSSQLKKWLILLTRLSAFSAIILAFSQPYFSNKSDAEVSQTIIYLDNSLSMQSKINGVEKLKYASNEIIENLKESKNISLITNDHTFSNIDVKSLKNELISLNYSSINLDVKTILLKLEQLKNIKTNSLINLVLISDFNDFTKNNISSVTNVNSTISIINLNSSEEKNSWIDSIYISNKNNQEITLKVKINNVNLPKENVSISLFNASNLIGKATTPLSKNNSSEVEFKIPAQKNITGKISIEDENLHFDNTLYFNISNPEKIDVLSIGKNSIFLSRIYVQDEFNFTQKSFGNLDYNAIQNNQLIILNELDKIPTTLNSSLKSYVKNGGNLVVIPSKEINITLYNQFFNNLAIGTISKSLDKELKITTINYEHPLFNGVFEKQIENFQYPTTNFTYKSRLNNAIPIVNIENNESFISEIKSNEGTVYWFASPLDKDVTNFKNTPLIVPVFYNFGKYSFKIPQLYYTIGNENNISIKTKINKDNVLTLKNDANEFIPLQRVYHNKVELTTNDHPKESGFYQITNNNEILRTIAYNYNRNESQLKNPNLPDLLKGVENINISDSIESTLNQINEQQQIKPLFKWFLGLAILFLLLEIGILKFFKV
ncbi:MAG: BatA domain-containing protein [Urechidicola sp.]|nr:BatA domain-containing protein [Urechidicola sp.]